MGRIIQGQVTASTALDSHGEKLTRKEIRELFLQTPDPMLFTYEHDYASKPVARGFNQRLEELSSGELAIRVDLEVLDEEAFTKVGGVSIAFQRSAWRFGNGSCKIQILINPQQFDFKETAHSLARLIPEECRRELTFDVTERVEKADLTDLTIVGIAFYVGAKILDGIWEKVGESICELIKSCFRKRHAANPHAILQFQFTLEVDIGDRKVPVVLRAEPNVTSAELALVKSEVLAQAARDLIGTDEVYKLIGVISQGPTFAFETIVMSDGECRTPGPTWPNARPLTSNWERLECFTSPSPAGANRTRAWTPTRSSTSSTGRRSLR